MIDVGKAAVGQPGLTWARHTVSATAPSAVIPYTGVFLLELTMILGIKVQVTVVVVLLLLLRSSYSYVQLYAPLEPLSVHCTQ